MKGKGAIWDVIAVKLQLASHCKSLQLTKKYSLDLINMFLKQENIGNFSQNEKIRLT